MKRVLFYRWVVFDAMFGKCRLTTYHMTREEAEKRFQGAVPEPSSRQVRFRFDDAPPPGQIRGQEYRWRKRVHDLPAEC